MKTPFFLSSCGAWYRHICSIEEIESQPILQWMFGAVLLYFYSAFSGWIGNANTTVEAVQRGSAICWPYFQNCTSLYFLHGFPYGYSQSILYMVFFGIMALIVYFMWQKDWVKAHALTVILLLWEVFVVFFVSFTISGPYNFYHIALTFILLFAPHKEYFLKFAFVFMYFMSTTAKFSPAWVLGTYFTSMKSSLPIFPEAFVPLLTNLVIFVQVVDCWFLLSRHWILQRLSLAFGIAFHLFSVVLVSYNYPTVALPPLLILFGPLYRHTPIPFTRRAIMGWLCIAALGLFQLVGFFSPNRFLTLEGHRYGMYMFESNHQCVITTHRYSSKPAPASQWSGLQCNGLFCTTETGVSTKNGITDYYRKIESASAWNRCDPYEAWSIARANCANPDTVRMSMQIDHSINGEPFYRIVDEPSICALTYKAFGHNEWIKLPPEAPVVGYPVENFYSLR